MKRWGSISVAMLASVSLIALSACEEPTVEAAVFEGLQQCLENPDMDPDQCRDNFSAARTQHAAVAPKYSSAQDCQADFGAERCEKAPYQTSGGGSVFMPLMMGYMMGSMLGGRGGVAAQPLYRSAGDSKSFRTADNKNVGSKTGRTRVASSAASRPSAKTSTIRRGGFGRSGGRFGSSAT
jgi:uncharacterized protein YgiB involved in biofilm formation